jgi:glycosyltransferase involved in cell wall biosynthesis
MQVLFVYKDYYPVLGGIEGHIRILAEGLASRGVEVQVLVTNTDRHTVTEQLNGVAVTKCARLGNISSAPLSLDLIRRVGDFRPDIAHLHFPYPVGELATLWRSRARRLVVTYHSDIVRQRYLGWAYQPFVRRLLARADAIAISNPTFLRNSSNVAAQAPKCVVIPYGQDLARFEPTPQSRARARELRAQYGERIALFVGKLRYYKGVENLIAAMCEVNPGLQTLIAGTGPMEAPWKALAQAQGVDRRVHFVGRVPDEQLPAYYQAAQMFVLPSSHPSETWGIVQSEAMASGLPCICTELGTGTSYVNQNGITGLVVPPRDPHALATAINRLDDDEPERLKMGQAALTRARAEFSHTLMIERTLKLYERLLA